MEQQPSILIVDDVPANLDLLREILSDDYRVKVATNGEKALELARRDPPPDLVLLDVMMPGMDDYEVCQELKQHPKTTPIPVIFVTAMTQAEDEQRGLALGAVDYITKPYDPEIVKARVSTHLQQYRTTQQLIAENRELRSTKARSFTDFDEQRLAALLQQGEGDQLEFKSTLRWNLFADKSDKNIENSCLKSVAAYLNTDGGILLIGVNDDGEILGIRNDHFKTEDKFLLHWVNLLKSYLGAEFIPFIRSMACDVGDSRILVVECLRSTKPVFFRRDNQESFFVRMSNTTQALKPSEVLAYIEQHFGSNRPRSELASVRPDQPADNSRPESSQKAETGFTAWITQLRERHVIRTAVLYLGIAWFITEAGTTVAETLEAPSWVPRVIVYGFIGGFPLVFLLSWIYDMRLVREQPTGSRASSRKTTWLIISIAALSAALIWRLATSGG
jgi:CheY-like chemotaxis protein